MLYSYECDDCGEVQDAHRRLEDRHDCPPCRCGGKTKKIITAAGVIADLEAYYDENLESHIKSRQHRKKVMREQGVSEYYGKGWQ